VAPEINTTWLGLVGPGVAATGVNNGIWSDHTDIQPTMLALLGLSDDYTPDGVVLGDAISPLARPRGMRANYRTLATLGQVYTQLEAAVGQFGLATLTASTTALASNSPGDSTYTTVEHKLQVLGAARDAVAAQMQTLLIGAEFGGKPINPKVAKKLIAAGNVLLAQAGNLANG
jgi:hypothetical protein